MPKSINVFTPAKVNSWLVNRGWTNTSGAHWERWDDSDIIGQQFDWPEALAYELFKMLILLDSKED